MNEIYEKYNSVKKECEYWAAEYEALKVNYDVVQMEAKEATDLRRANAELEGLVKRLTSERDMLKECIIRMTMDRLGVS